MIKKAIIIGAGPAGLTAAYELLKKTDIQPVIYEMSGGIGGISKTVNYKGNLLDVGSHRFFSKSDLVMDWWFNLLPLQGKRAKDDKKLGRKIELSKKKGAPDPEKDDKVMLVRGRLTRIFYLKKFFDYPISLTLETMTKIGFLRMIKIVVSYVNIRLKPIREEKSLEDFFINRFGKELYLTFFKDYTEKLWGIECNKIAPDWGAQRIKGLSIGKAIRHALSEMRKKDQSKGVETSLIAKFYTPKYGAGQMWETASDEIEKMGGKIYLNKQVVRINWENEKITSVVIRDEKGVEVVEKADYFFSTMPVSELIEGMGEKVPNKVKKVAKGLVYRDFISVGLFLKKMKIKNETKIKTINDVIPDSWVYVQERSATMCRFQVFNNWSPYILKDENVVCLGLEYMVSEKDKVWQMTDDELSKFAIKDLMEIGVIDPENVVDQTVARMKKAYPAYFGTYGEFDKIKEFADRFENLYLIGRNGMHKYNNMDHSMLSAMEAVDLLINHDKNRTSLWNINSENNYHEKIKREFK